MDAELERICAPDYLGDLTQRTIEDVRTMRTECQAVETGLSYLRRMVQGRLDIVTGELDRRQHGGDPADMATLIGKLPEILSDRTRAPGVGRLPQMMAPGDVTGALAAELDDIVVGGRLDALPELADDTLSELQGRLENLEHEVSARRRDVFSRIDALQAELIRRYRTGEATVETLLA